MKNKSGFTLVELLVGMLVTGLIMAALVTLFSSTVQSEISGFKQQEVYAQARAVVNDLKTTLRYADSAAVFYQGSNPITAPKENTGAVKNIDSVEYTATIYNSSKATNESVKMTVEWAPNSNKKLLQITKSIDGVAQPVVKFPKDVNNSVFKGDGSDFPITVNKDDDSLYHINIPYKYKFALSGDKTDNLNTDVLKGEESSSSDVPPILFTGTKLVMGQAGSINAADNEVLAIKVNEPPAGLNSNSKFTVVSNMDNVWSGSNQITVINDAFKLDGIINKYSRINRYNVLSSNQSDGNEYNGSTLVFNSDTDVRNYMKVSLYNQSTKEAIITVKGNNAIYTSNETTYIGKNKNCGNVILSEGTTGSLILAATTSGKITLENLNIPKEIAVLIVSAGELKITNCTIENCIIFHKTGNAIITNSSINGMIESAGSELQIVKNCDFGTFKGSPTALEVFDAYYGYKG